MSKSIAGQKSWITSKYISPFCLTVGVTLFFLLGFTKINAQSIAAGNGVYQFLKLQHSKGHLPEYWSSQYPLSRKVINAALDHLNKLDSNSNSLQTWEKQELERYSLMFLPIGDSKTRLLLRDSIRYLKGALDFHANLYHADSLPKSQTYAFGSLSVKAEGQLNQSLGFVSQASIGSEQSYHPRFKEHYQPSLGLPYNVQAGKTRLDSVILPQNKSTLDGFRTLITWESGGALLEGGYDWNQWGPGIWQHPTFSPNGYFWVQDSLSVDTASQYEYSPDAPGYRRGYTKPYESPPLAMLRFSYNWKMLRYTKTTAQRTSLLDTTKAFVSAHQLELHLGKSWVLGFHELVLYSNRSLEPLYSIPLVPLKFAEHQLGDRDNMLIGLSLEYTWFKRGRFFSELLLDDLLGPGDLLRDWWGNKFALTFGAEIFTTANGISRIEFSRVEPWLFGHHRHDNQAQNFGALLGSSLPPNSQLLRVQHQEFFANSLSGILDYQIMQRDALGRGSSIFDIHNSSVDGTQKSFLENPETRQTMLLSLQWKYGLLLALESSIGAQFIDNWKGQGKSLASPIYAATGTLHY